MSYIWTGNLSLYSLVSGFLPKVTLFDFKNYFCQGTEACYATKRFKIPSAPSYIRYIVPLFTHPLNTNLWDLECSPLLYWNGTWNSEMFWLITSQLHTITRICRRPAFGGISGMQCSLCLSIHKITTVLHFQFVLCALWHMLLCST